MSGRRLSLLALAVSLSTASAGAAGRVAENAALQAQREWLAARPGLEVTYTPSGAVRTLEGDTGVVLADATADSAPDSGAAVLRAFAPVLLATGGERLV